MQLTAKEKISRLDKSRLRSACELVDPIEEQCFAEMGASSDLEEWPEYWGSPPAA